MQGTCSSGSSEIPTAQKVEAPSMVPTHDSGQIFSIMGLLDLLLQSDVKVPKTTHPRSSDIQHRDGKGACVCT